jgi:hypothetical protein
LAGTQHDKDTPSGGNDVLVLSAARNAGVCLDLRANLPDSAVFIGDTRYALSDLPRDLRTGRPCAIAEPRDVACGAPSINPAREAGMFIWRDCDTARGDATWHVRATAGGSSVAVAYEGTLRTQGPLTRFDPYRLEPSDELAKTDAHTLRFAIDLHGVGIDGFDLATARSAGVCVRQSSDLPVYVGAGKIVATGDAALWSGDACAALE